jgi:hypothetical protein
MITKRKMLKIGVILAANGKGRPGDSGEQIPDRGKSGNIGDVVGAGLQ